MRRRGVEQLHEDTDLAVSEAAENAVLFEDEERNVVLALGVEGDSGLPEVGMEEDANERPSVSTPFQSDESDYFVS